MSDNLEETQTRTTLRVLYGYDVLIISNLDSQRCFDCVHSILQLEAGMGGAEEI